MAITDSVVWEVRTTGSNSNGGGFCATIPNAGTDYSQQDAPAVTGSDLEINSGNQKRIRSASGLINASHIGNIINVTGGTGFIVGRFLIYADAGGGWFDVHPAGGNVGTTGSTGGSFVIGGALGGTDLKQAIDEVQVIYDGTNGGGSRDGNLIWVKSGTYTITNFLGISSFNVDKPLRVVGYYETRGDLKGRITSFDSDHTKRPLVQCNMATSATVLSQSNAVILENFRFVHVANTSGLGTISGAGSLYLNNCFFDLTGSTAVYGFNATTDAEFHNCEFVNCGTSTTIRGSSTDVPLTLNCIFRTTGTTSRAIEINTNSNQLATGHIYGCVFEGFTGEAISVNQATTGTASITQMKLWIKNCVFRNNNIAVRIYERFPARRLLNCIFEGNTIAIDLINMTDTIGGYENLNYLAFYNNTNNVRALSSPLASTPEQYLGRTIFNLTASPLTDPANGDWSTSDPNLLSAGVVNDTIGLPGGGGSSFQDTLQPTRDHYWDVAAGAKATLQDGVPSTAKNDSGYTHGNRNLSTQPVKVDVSEDASMIQKALTTGKFAIINTVGKRMTAYIASVANDVLLSGASNTSNRNISKRVKGYSSEQIATQVRSGKWNIFDHSWTGGATATLIAGGWDLTTDSDQAADLEANKTDKAAHPSKSSPGRVSFIIGGRIVTRDYASRGLF